MYSQTNENFILDLNALTVPTDVDPHNNLSSFPGSSSSDCVDGGITLTRLGEQDHGFPEWLNDLDPNVLPNMGFEDASYGFNVNNNPIHSSDIVPPPFNASEPILGNASMPTSSGLALPINNQPMAYPGPHTSTVTVAL